MSSCVKLVAVDPGKYGTKATCNGKRYYVRSLVDLVENVPTENGQRVKFFDKEYIIGDESIKFNFEPSKQTMETKLLTYLAITKLVDTGDKINLMVGMPLEHWLDRTRRAKYQRYLENSLVKLNTIQRDKEYCTTFKIESVTVLPETIGHIYLAPEFKTRTVGVLDCGGCNFQGAIYKNMVPIVESCFTLNEGGNYFLNSVKHTLNSKFGLNYQDYQIQDLITNGSNHELRNQIESEIENTARRHLKKVLTEAKARNWNLDDMIIVLTGGGTVYFKKIIHEFLPNVTISDNEIWDNVSGFGVIGEQIHGKNR